MGFSLSPSLFSSDSAGLFPLIIRAIASRQRTRFRLDRATDPTRFTQPSEALDRSICEKLLFCHGWRPSRGENLTLYTFSGQQDIITPTTVSFIPPDLGGIYYRWTINDRLTCLSFFSFLHGKSLHAHHLKVLAISPAPAMLVQKSAFVFNLSKVFHVPTHPDLYFC